MQGTSAAVCSIGDGGEGVCLHVLIETGLLHFGSTKAWLYLQWSMLYTFMAVSCATRQVQSVADMCEEAEGVVYVGVEKAVAALVASQERGPYRTG